MERWASPSSSLWADFSVNRVISFTEIFPLPIWFGLSPRYIWSEQKLYRLCALLGCHRGDFPPSQGKLHNVDFFICLAMYTSSMMLHCWSSLIFSSQVSIVQTCYQVVKVGRQYLSASYQFTFRLFKALLFLGATATVVALSIICDLSMRDLVVCCLAFLPTGWGLIMVSSE